MKKRPIDIIADLWNKHKSPTHPRFRAIGNSILAATLLAYEFSDELGLKAYEGKVILIGIIMKFLTTLKNENTNV